MRQVQRPLASLRPRWPSGLTLLALAALSACGGGGSGPSETPPVVTPPARVAVAGVVADGPLQGATVCYDLNDNGACDSGEPTQAATDADGKYSFDVLATDAGKHAVVALVPATAVDKDSGAPVGAAYTLKSPPSGSAAAQVVFVSPLTTLVVEVAAAQGVTPAEAVATVQAQLGLAQSPLTNFVASGDTGAATMAKTVNTVIVEVAKLADAAKVDEAAKKALVASVTSADLSTLAELVKGATATAPAAIAQQVAATVLEDRNLSASTVADQAATAQVIATTATATAAAPATGPFVSARRFTMADANNHQLQAFIGDATPLASGRFFGHEWRENVAGGNAVAFNRNTAYWNKDKAAWEVCNLSWQVVDVKPATATTPQDSLYCGVSRTRSTIAEVDIAGRKMADVVREVRASTLRDAPGLDTDPSGLPTRWGPAPELLADTDVFPPGSRLAKRDEVGDVGDTERFSLVDLPTVPAVAGGTNNFRQAAVLESLLRMQGNAVNADAAVSNLNTLFLDDLPATAASATLRAVKRYRVGFDASGNAVRYWACDVVDASNASQNCVAAGTGSFSVADQGDARVMRFAGYPSELTVGLKRQRLLVQRSGTVFGGYRDLERKRFNQRLNTPAFEALRKALALPALPSVASFSAPATAGAFSTLRNFSFTDANNYNLRFFNGDSSVLDAQGYFLADEVRHIRNAGADQAFARNALYWTGASWFNCGDSGLGINRINSVAPFDSDYCSGSYVDERLSSMTVTLDGRLMGDVVRAVRGYASDDIAFDHAGWGPNPNVHTVLNTTPLPAGSTLEYRVQSRKATPLGISTAATSQVRAAPADTSTPFNSWPFAATLEEWVARNPGDLNGGPLNGGTAYFVHNTFLSAPAAADQTNEVQFRVAFNPATQAARFYRNNRAAATGNTVNYVKLLDTTYSIETVGSKKVLKFAAMPANFEADFGFQRMFMEHNGGVWYGFKDSIPADGKHYSIRINGTAARAMMTALGAPL